MSMHRPRRALAVLLSLVSTVAVSLGSLAATATPAQAAAPSYVALGDSYSSGTGTRSYINDGTSCLRSTYAYPSLLAAQRGYALNFRACSGANISDVTNTQLSALGAGTSFVTISVGGNDAGFADVLTECAFPGWASDCNGAINGAQSYINNTLPGRLGTLYSSIRSRASAATVVVVGYPRIFMGEDCNAGTWFSSTEQTRLNQTADLLNSKLSAAAAARGFRFANPTSRFIGHAVCDDVEWLNGLSYPVRESYHPNRLGHSSGYSPVVASQLGFAARIGAKVLARAKASADDQARLQRRYAAADRRITPESFRVPDMRSQRVRDAAAARGIDLDRWLARHT
jgi:hypothetical protein